MHAAKRFAAGSLQKLVLSHMDISRDWGWAPD
jgi:GDPmannose 4,6-dehydratase